MAYKVRLAVPMGNSASVQAWLRNVSATPGTTLSAVAALLIAAFALLFLPKIYLVAALALALVSLGMMFLIASTVHARVNGVLLTWLLISPLAYYFLSVPTAKPIFTFDRFVLALLTGAIIFIPRQQAVLISTDMKRAAFVWGVFVFFAFTSLAPVWADLGLAGTRLITEAFIFPGLLALFVIRVFPAERYVRLMHTLIGVMAMYCAGIGLIELVTGQDLLPIPNGIFYGNEQTGALPRVNGPFDANYCLAIIGAICLFLLLFLHDIVSANEGRGRKWFHRLAVVAALVMALLPQFRTLTIALGIVLLLELFRNRTLTGRVRAFVLVLSLVASIALLAMLAPSFFENRVSDPANFYARVAQQEQTWNLFTEHPLNGAGLANFMQAVQGVSATNFQDVDSINTAHNSLGSILAETGIAGALPFVAGTVLWFLCFFALRRRNTPVATNGYRYFLYIFICYWLMAMTLTSAYERDLNLWYMFACALIYKLAMQEQRMQSALSPAINS
jgi:hypothetical protein